MPKTVEEAFEKFLAALTPLRSEQKKAKSHKASVKSCLVKSIGCHSLFETGSIKNRTGIRNYSDTDYFAQIPRELARIDSRTQLRELKEALQYTFCRTSEIRVTSPSVTIRFTGHRSEHLEITPCVAYGLMDTDFGRRKTYAIPNGTGEWMYSSPQAHKDYVAYHDQRLGGRLRPLIKLIKAWKYFCNVPVYSFYLELRITKLFQTRQHISYPRDVHFVFNNLWNIELARINDPMGISGMVRASSSEQRLDAAYSKVRTAAVRAEKALYHHDRDPNQAFHYWILLFGGYFPARVQATKRTIWRSK